MIPSVGGDNSAGLPCPRVQMSAANMSSSSGSQPASHLSRSFRAHPSSLYQIREFIRERASAEPLPSEVADDLLLAVSEACVNAVVHTNSSIVTVTWRPREDCVEVEVRDQGVFDRKVLGPSLDEDEAGGRGILLMTAVMDEVAIQEGTAARPGTVVTLVKCVRVSDSAAV